MLSPNKLTNQSTIINSLRDIQVYGWRFVSDEEKGQAKKKKVEKCKVLPIINLGLNHRNQDS